MEVHPVVYYAVSKEKVLTRSEAKEYIKWINEESGRGMTQNIVSYREKVEEIYKKLEKSGMLENIKSYKINDTEWELVGPSDFITISKGRLHLRMHMDEPGYCVINNTKYSNYKCLFKALIYLNPARNKYSDPYISGTTFYTEKRKVTAKINSRTGKGVIFDIREWHAGNPIGRDCIKYTLGIRLVYRKKEKQTETVKNKQ